jgi:two-component system chemotaxis response regulator CheY
MPQSESRPAAPRPIRVQVVEDLARVQTLLRELIEEPGRLEVAAMADNEETALLQFETLQPDAVVIDLALRSGTGLGLIQSIRRRQGERRPLLIVLTNYTQPTIASACLKAGADHFLDKSRDFMKVRTLLDAVA